jgi:hypothetical protein
MCLIENPRVAGASQQEQVRQQLAKVLRDLAEISVIADVLIVSGKADRTEGWKIDAALCRAIKAVEEMTEEMRRQSIQARQQRSLLP